MIPATALPPLDGDHASPPRSDRSLVAEDVELSEGLCLVRGTYSEEYGIRIDEVRPLIWEGDDVQDWYWGEALNVRETGDLDLQLAIAALEAVSP